MAAAAKDAKAAGRKEINPLVIEAAIKREETIRANFAANWGELVTTTTIPKSVDEALDLKKTQLLSETQKHGAAAGALGTSYGQYEDSMRRMNPEAGLQKAYRVLRAGV